MIIQTHSLYLKVGGLTSFAVLQETAPKLQHEEIGTLSQWMRVLLGIHCDQQNRAKSIMI